MTEQNTNPFDGFNEAVLEFNTAFDTPKGIEFWQGLVKEETIELVEAMAIDLSDNTLTNHANVLKEACDLAYVILGLQQAYKALGEPLPVEVIFENGALVDTVADVFGVQTLREAFFRVHKSNMSKLGDDGKPVKREDGKVLKGPNYEPPNLLDLATESFLSTAESVNQVAA